MSDYIQHGKTVRVFMPDGKPTGIRHAEVVNWTGQAIACPRHRVSELAAGWPEEASRPGVYMLFGESDIANREAVYVGEGENVLRRLNEHVRSKDFWQRVVFFTNKDYNLTKAHVRYLEHRLLQLILEARRCEVANGNRLSNSEPPPLSRADRAAMEEFIDYARLLLGALGFPSLDPVATPRRTGDDGVVAEDEGEVFTFSIPRRQVQAKGYLTDEGFLVLRGSIGARAGNSLQQSYVHLQEKLIEEGTLVAEGDLLRMTEDYLFSSPSAASGIMAGYNISGRQCWKTTDGRTLAEWEAEQLEEVAEADL